MNNPDFTKMVFNTGKPQMTYKKWAETIQKETGMPAEDLVWKTVEQIDVTMYTRKAYDGLDHLGYHAGIPPYLRGPYATMYVMRPWTVRQYAGFSTAEESNAFYKKILRQVRKAFPLPLTLPLTVDMTLIIPAF